MTTYIEYELEDGTSLLVEAAEVELEGVARAGRGNDTVIVKAGKRFGEALAGIQTQAREFVAMLRPTGADEVEVKFGLKSTGELGNFAIGNVGLEAAYEVTLKWKKEPEEKSKSA
jgi:hypothetical protein